MRSAILLVLNLVFALLTSVHMLQAAEAEPNMEMPEKGEVETQPESLLSIFESGLKFYSEKKFSEAQKEFEKALQLDPLNATLSYNLGLTFMELKQIGPAAAYLRKAKELDPVSRDIAHAWDSFTEKNRIPEPPRSLSMWDILLQNIRSVPHILLYFLAFVATFAFGLTLLRWAKEKRKTEEMDPSPAWVLISSVFVLLTFSLYAIKLYEKNIPKGTLLAETSSIKSAPEESSSEITQFLGGMEVFVFEAKGDWFKIQYPGSFSGWVKADSLMITTLTSPKQIH